MKRPEKPIPTLFFDERGCGPDACDLGLHPMPPLEYEGKVIAKRSVGLRVFVSPHGIGGFMFAVAGGYQLYEEQALALRDQLTAWLDAPKLEARKGQLTVLFTREPSDGVLVQSAVGEWGAGCAVDDIIWCTSESEAREYFAELTGVGFCEHEWCRAACNRDDLREEGEDGPRVCPRCYEQAVADFQAADMEHAEPSECAWRGKGADVGWNDEDEAICPTCGECVHEASPALELGDIADAEDTRG